MNDLLNERSKTHGDFKDTARISLELKRVIHSNERVIFSDVQLESLDLICTKLARIMSGDQNAVQHWEDVVGYAQLVVNDLEARPEKGGNSMGEILDRVGRDNFIASKAKTEDGG